MSLVVLQSHRQAAPGGWLQRCLDSVRHWARDAGHGYRFVDDALFDLVPPALRERTRAQPVVATDLARLHWLRQVLDEGHEAALWLDADTLVTVASGPELPADDHAVGREVWVDLRDGRVKLWRKVHNAYLLFRPGNPLLDWYAHSASAIVGRHSGRHLVPQLVGPKLLTAMHNICALPVCESAGVLSPAVIADIVAGDGPALERFRAASVPPTCLNLCASSVARGDLDDARMNAVIDRLLAGVLQDTG